MDIDDPISTLPKMGSERVKKLAGLGLTSISDLLTYFPSRYLDFSKFIDIKNLNPGEIVTIRGTIKSIQGRFSFKTRTALAEGVVSDHTGSIKVVWFNQNYLAKSLKTGDKVLLSGKVEYYKGVQLTNPVHEKITSETVHTGRLVPVYYLPDGVYNRTFRELIAKILPLTKYIPNTIPDVIQQSHNIMPLETAIREMHFPQSSESLKQAQARMIFEEVFIQQLAVEQHKSEIRKLSAPKIPTDIDFIKHILAGLPFGLTLGQKKALWEIIQDLENTTPMNRLLQGDVGSGKTIVALIAALTVIRAGYQAVILAPTEILATQHYDSILKFSHSNPLDKKTTSTGLLTRHFCNIDGKKVTKKHFLEQLGNGNIDILAGTHAVLGQNIEFKNLGLVIIDEQHRFGVEQRARLLGNADSANLNKRRDSAISPHLLSMTATPIPRTLALSMYSDLTVSTITELPQGRQVITTNIVIDSARKGAYDFITKELNAGRQAFIITPLVEESEKLDVKSVKAEFLRLAKDIFPRHKLGLLYGTMKGLEKEAAMSAFNNREIDVLVATSVVEIGIDVPNATVIVIENADRFGLAQLHQLRGRVGRGDNQSHCMLFTASANEKTIERLNFFASCNNGFTLAEMDMKQRGFGSLFGKKQTGFNFAFGQYLNLEVLETAKQAATSLTKTSPNLERYPLLKEKVLPLVGDIHLE